MISRLITLLMTKIFPSLEEHKELIRIFSNIFVLVCIVIIISFVKPDTVYYCPQFNASLANFTGTNFTLP